VAYQGAREATRLRGRGIAAEELLLVRVHLPLVCLEGVVVLLPLHIHVRLVSVVGAVVGVFALLLVVDLVLKQYDNG
jgi:hypothetical protein